MNFKQLLKKYKEGTATQDEIDFIKKELEKHQAIEEYISGEIYFDNNLYKSMDFDFPPDEDKTFNDESRNIKKNVNRRLRKVVFTSVSIVFAIYFIIFFILSPIIDIFFYNPTKISIGENTQDLFYDMSAITRLNMPGSLLYGSSASKDGFGKYDISISRKDLFQQETEQLNLKINRNMRNSFKFTEPTNYDFPFSLNNASDDFIKNNNDRTLYKIKELNPVSYISSYITFKEDLTMQELVDLKEKYRNNNIEFIWAGIRTEAKTKADKSELSSHVVTGFSLALESRGSPNGDLPDQEKYPAFDYLEWVIRQDSNTDPLADGYALHYKSLLQYVIDRHEASDTIEGSLKHDYYKNSLKYVEENGVKAFGLLIYADARDLLEFVKNEDIKYIQLNEVIPLRKNF